MVKKLKCHKKVDQNKDFCLTVMEFQIDNVLQFNQHMSQIKCHILFTLTLKLWLKETDWFSKNPEKYSTTKIGKYVPCRYLTATIWAFDSIENKHSLYRGEDCMKKFCSRSLKEHELWPYYQKHVNHIILNRTTH